MSDKKDLLDDGEHFGDVFQQLRQMQKSGILCDGEVEAQGQHVKIHRILLVAASSYFSDKFTECSHPCERVHIEGVTAEGLISALVFIYTGRLSLTWSNIHEVHHACHVLCLQRALTLCDLYRTQHSVCSTQGELFPGDPAHIKSPNIQTKLSSMLSLKTSHDDSTQDCSRNSTTNLPSLIYTSRLSSSSHRNQGHLSAAVSTVANTTSYNPSHHTSVSTLPSTYPSSSFYPYRSTLDSLIRYQMYHGYKLRAQTLLREGFHSAHPVSRENVAAQCTSSKMSSSAVNELSLKPINRSQTSHDVVSVVRTILNEVINSSVDIAHSKIFNYQYPDKSGMHYQCFSDDENKENYLGSILPTCPSGVIDRATNFSEKSIVWSDHQKHTKSGSTTSLNHYVGRYDLTAGFSVNPKRARENDQPLNLTKPPKQAFSNSWQKRGEFDVQNKREFTGYNLQLLQNTRPNKHGLTGCKKQVSTAVSTIVPSKPGVDSPCDIQLKPAMTSNNEGLVECPRCRAAFPTNVAMKRHWIHCRESSLSNNALSCHRCIKEFLTIEDYKVHLAQAHPSSPNKNDNKRHICEVCSSRFKSNKLLHSHKFTAHKIPIDQSQYQLYTCEKCDYVTIYLSRLAFHVQITHSDLKPFECTKCDKTFKTRAKLRVHDNLHSKQTHYPCHRCSSVFYTASHRRMHVITTHKQQKDKAAMFSCYVCQKWSSDTYTTVLQHIIANHGSDLISTDFKCWCCDAVCKDACDLCLHSTIHLTNSTP